MATKKNEPSQKQQRMVSKKDEPSKGHQGDAAVVASPGPLPEAPPTPKSRVRNSVLKSGPLFLSTKGIGWTSWKKRWFILTQTSLVFFKSDPNAIPQKENEVNLILGGIDLNNSGSVVVKADKKLLTVLFQDGQDGRTFTLKAESSEDLYEWRAAFENALSQASSSPHVLGKNDILGNEKANAVNGSEKFLLMNPNNCTNGPSHQSIAIESVEISVQNLIKNWYKRQQWQHIFNPRSSSPSSKAPWRNHLAKFLESVQIRILAISLLLFDLIVTTLELSSTLVSCSKTIEKSWFHWVGISILTLLSTKIAALAVALGIGGFLRRPGYVVDGVVVIGALVLETVWEAKGGGLLVVVSLWRVVRVVESALELSDEAIEAQIEAIVCQFEALRVENSRLLDTIAGQNQIIETLEKEVDQNRHASDPNGVVGAVRLYPYQPHFK